MAAMGAAARRDRRQEPDKPSTVLGIGFGIAFWFVGSGDDRAVAGDFEVTLSPRASLTSREIPHLPCGCEMAIVLQTLTERALI